MSIILKALKSAREDSQLSSPAFAPEPASVTSSQEGFFSSSDPVISKKAPNSQSSHVPFVPFKGSAFKTWHIMLAVFIVLMAFSGTYAWITRGPKTDFIPPQAAATNVSNQNSGTTAAPVADATALSQQANAAFKNQDWDAAMPLFKQALQLTPNNAQLHNSLGMVFLHKELFSSAQTEFQSALELDAKCSECFNNFGYLKSLLGDAVEAKTYLEKSIALSAKYPDPYFNLAVLSEKSGDVASAVKYYREFVALYPNQDEDIVKQIKTRVRDLSGQ